MKNTSTKDLTKIRKETKQDAINLVYSNPTESDKLSILSLKIWQELRNRGIK